MSIYLYRSIYTHTDNRTALGNLVILVVFDLFHLNLGQTTSAVRPTRWREKNTNTHTHHTTKKKADIERERAAGRKRESTSLPFVARSHVLRGYYGLQ